MRERIAEIMAEEKQKKEEFREFQRKIKESIKDQMMLKK